MSKHEHLLYFACNIILILLGFLLIFLEGGIVGGSLVASGIAGLIMYWAICINRKKGEKEKQLLQALGRFGITSVLPRRLTKDEGHDLTGKARRAVDILGFGLGRFREDVSDGHLEKIARKVDVRILTVHPESQYCDQRDYEEDRKVGSIEQDAVELAKFIKSLNNPHVNLRWYKAIPTTHILRVDNTMLVGAYIIGLPSRTTFTLKLEAGVLFDYYLKHFDKIWNDPNLSCETELEKLALGKR
jgi:hypothetical protein